MVAFGCCALAKFFLMERMGSPSTTSSSLWCRAWLPEVQLREVFPRLARYLASSISWKRWACVLIRRSLFELPPGSLSRASTRAASVAGFGQCFLHLATDLSLLQRTDLVNHQNAIEMIVFVLDGHCEQAIRLQFKGLA